MHQVILGFAPLSPELLSWASPRAASLSSSPKPKGVTHPPVPPQSLCLCLCCTFGAGTAELPTRGQRGAGRDGQNILPFKPTPPPGAAPGGSSLWQRTEAPAGQPASTPISLADSDNQDTPRFSGSHRRLHPCRQSGVQPANRGDPTAPRHPAPHPVPIAQGGARGQDGGGGTVGGTGR